MGTTGARRRRRGGLVSAPSIGDQFAAQITALENALLQLEKDYLNDKQTKIAQLASLRQVQRLITPELEAALQLIHIRQ